MISYIDSRMTITYLTASAAPIGVKCAGAVLPIEGTKISSDDGPARMGSAAHEAMEPGAESISAIAARWDVDPDELLMKSNLAKILADKDDAGAGERIVERQLETQVGVLTLRGRPDAICVDPATEGRLGDNEPTVIDYKFGRLHSDYSAQIKTYALLAARSLDLAPWGRVHTKIYWVMEGEIEAKTYDVEDLEGWGKWLAKHFTGWGGEYRPGAHCEYCKHSHTCSALQEHAATAIKSLGGATDQTITDYSDGDLIDLWDRVGLIESITKAAKQSIKMQLSNRGGVLGDDDRGKLTRIVATRNKLATRQSAQILSDTFGPDAAECLDVGMGKLRKLCRDKGVNFNGLLEQLDLAGALSKIEYPKYRRLSRDQPDKPSNDRVNELESGKTGPAEVDGV